MELNDIPLKYEDVQTAKQQSLAITHCYFKQPMKQFLQQLNIQDSNAQLWLAEFAWHDTSSNTLSQCLPYSRYGILVRNLQILAAHQYQQLLTLNF